MAEKVRRQAITEKDKERIAELWRSGLPRSKIALELCRSENTVKDVIYRLQRNGVIQRRADDYTITDDDITALSVEYNVSESTVAYLLKLSKKRSGAEALPALRSLLALYCSQGKRCYYTGLPLSDSGSRKAVLVKTEGLGSVFCTDIVRSFRGKLGHRTFLRMVKAISTTLF